jgi:hypothetical protein
MTLSREYFCSPSYCFLDKPVPGIACVVKNYAYSISVYVQSVRMPWFLTKKSLLHFFRAGKYEKEVHILRKYIGDILIGTYEEKLQLSQLSHNRIELVEVLKSQPINNASASANCWFLPHGLISLFQNWGRECGREH